MIAIDVQSGKPIYEQIVERFETLIVSGVLAPDLRRTVSCRLYARWLWSFRLIRIRYKRHTRCWNRKDLFIPSGDVEILFPVMRR